MSSKGFSTTPGLDGALVKAKNRDEPRWGTIGTCFGMLGTEYVLVMFEEFDGYVVAVPVAEFAEHYCLLPHTLEGNRGSIPFDEPPSANWRPPRPEELQQQSDRRRLVARRLGFVRP